MDYKSAIEYLESSIKHGINPGLERISELAAKLGNPHLSYPAVHITGTNGKTSTARMVSAILSSAGLKTGLYTSPHLERVNERIVVGDEQIGDKEFAGLLFRIRPEIEGVNGAHDEKLTYFEILTALAFLYFRERVVDCAVVEVGMGGRWDATNLVTSRVAVITNVELEHSEYLGDTVEAIAREKVGIIKPGALVITGEKKSEILQIIEAAGKSAGAELKLLGRDFDYSSEGGIFTIKGLCAGYDNLFLGLRGEHQLINASLAVAAAEAFLGEALPEEGLHKVLKAVKSPGRLEVVRETPLVILDGAHNPHGAEILAKAIKALSYDKLILVLAILRDKDVDGILRPLCPLASFVVATENSNSRSLRVDDISQQISKYTQNFQAAGDVASAVELSLERAGRRDLVLITGSLYTVGEARTFLRKCAQGSRFEAQGQ